MDKLLSVGITAEDFPEAIFRPHGLYSAKVDGRFVRMVATGPFNAEMARIYAQRTGSLYSAINPSGPFGVLIEFHDSMMMCMEALQVFADFLASAKQKEIQTVGTAFVAADGVEGVHLMTGLFRSRVYEPANVPFKVFQTVPEAESWLNAQLDGCLQCRSLSE